MKSKIWLLLAIIGLPIISVAESDKARITKLEDEVKRLQEANAETLKKIDELRSAPVPIRRRVVPIPPQEKNTLIQEPEPEEVMEEFAGHKYRFVPLKKSWNAASKTASQEKGYLASITSEEENKFITTLIQKACAKRNDKNPHVWIGLNNDNNENKWTWESGEKFEFSSWCPGEPNNWGGFESAVQFNKNAVMDPDGVGKWNDMPSDSKTYFIIEIENPNSLNNR